MQYKGWTIETVSGGFHIALEGNSSADSGPPFATIGDARAEIDRCEEEWLDLCDRSASPE